MHWGDMPQAFENMDLTLTHMRRAMQLPDQQNEMFGLSSGFPVWANFAHAVDMPPERRETIASLMHDYNLTWRTADATADSLHFVTWNRPRGDRSKDSGALIGAEYYGIMGKFSYLLVASKPDVSTEEVMANLPSVESIIEESLMTISNSSFITAVCGWFSCPFLTVGAVCEKFGAHLQTLVYAAAALETDLTKGGNFLPTTKALALNMRGRALAALGRHSEAATAFEAAVEEAHKYQLWLLCLFALRDLKLCVLDAVGHGVHGSRRIGSVLRRLVGPPQALTPLLRGLDAGELMALEEPDPGYSTEIPEDEDGMVKLRQELMSLKPMALQKRASAEGVTDEQLAEAVDSAQPKSCLVELIIQCHVTTTQVASTTAAVPSPRKQDAAAVALLQNLKKNPDVWPRVEDALKHPRCKEAYDDVLANGLMVGMKYINDPICAPLIHLVAGKMGLPAPPAAAAPTGLEQEPNPTVTQATLIREELAGLRLTQLYQGALEEGVDSARVTTAMNSDNPRQEMIGLIISHRMAVESQPMCSVDTVKTIDQRRAELHRSLSAMRFVALQQRADEEGIEPGLVEDAFESERSPKRALIELIVAAVSKRW